MNATLDYYKRKEMPVLILATPAQTPVTTLGQAFNVISTTRFIEQDELTFDFPKSIDNGKTELEVYSKIQTKMNVILEGVGVYTINECPEDSSGEIPVKHVSAKSLEYEMLFKRVSAFTGTSMKFYDYVTAANTVMGRVMKIIPGWSISYIDPELLDLYRSFDAGTNTVYNLLTTDIAKAFGCIFRFNSLNKTISAYLIGNLEDNIGVYISQDNIANAITVTQYSDEIATALHCYGGGGLDIRRVNPLGGNIIYNFDYFINDTSNEWMSENLKEVLKYWNEKVKGKKERYSFLSLTSDVLQKRLVEINQSIADTKSALSSNITKLEGLNATPTEGLNSEALAELAASKQETIRDIANIKLAIRVLRRSKAEVQSDIDDNLSELRNIIHSLKFTGEESWRMIADDSLTMLKDIQYYSSNWGAIYFETTDEEEMDALQLNEEAPFIHNLFSELIGLLEDLNIEVASKELQYWAMSDSKTSSVLNRIAITMRAIDSIVLKLNNLISNTDIVINLRSIKERLSSYAGICGLRSNLTKEEYDELQNFIFYNTYTNDNIIITDLMNEQDVQNQSQELYNQSVETIKRVSTPRYEFSGDFLNILSNPKFSEFAEKIDLGKQVTIELPSGNILEDATLIEVIYEYDNPESFSMLFSNKVKINNSNFVFADMFIDGVQGSSGVSGITGGESSKGGAITTSDSITGNNLLSVTNAVISKLGFVSFGPNPPTEYGNYVGSWLGYDRGAKFSLYSSANDYLQWDGQKLLIKARNFTLDSAGNITANNADLSGKITAQSGYVGGWQILPGELYSTSGSIHLDSITPRISIGNASEKMSGDGVYMGKDNENPFLYTFRVGNPEKHYFMWDKNGIHISGSWIAGWEASPTHLSSGSGTNTVTISSASQVYTSKVAAFSAGGSAVYTGTSTDAKFRVYHNGDLYASNADITGSITATSGSIGGWGITSSCLVSGSVGLVGGGNTIRMWAGSSTPENAPFIVYNDGTLFASNAQVSGSITATTGSIGGWMIADNNLHSGSTTNYVEINSKPNPDNYTILAGGNNVLASPFVLYKDGRLKATDADLTGKITATSGSIAGWDIGGSTLTSPYGISGLTSGVYSFFAGNSNPANAPFFVTKDGALKASSGNVAGWNIGGSALIAPNNKVGIVSGTAWEDVAFYAGASTPIAAPFYVTHSGNLKATNADITGSITATSGSIGGWRIDNTYIAKDGIELNSTGNSTISVGLDSNKKIKIEGSGHIKSSNYAQNASGFQIDYLGNAEFNNILARGEIQTSVFKYNEIMATAGTFGVFKSADVLSEPAITPAIGNTFTIKTKENKYPMLEVNDIIRMKVPGSGSVIIADIWAKVLTVSGSNPPYSYVCRLESGSSGITLTEGTAVIDYGVKGDGFLWMDSGVSSTGFISGSRIGGSYYSVRTSGSEPWNEGFKEHLRLGAVNNFGGISRLSSASPVYGIGIGNYEKGYLYYTPETGLELSGTIHISPNSTGLPPQIIRSIFAPPRPKYHPNRGQPQSGDLWAGDYKIDTLGNKLYIYTETGWSQFSAGTFTISETQPSANSAGDYWYKSSSRELKVYNDNTFKLIIENRRLDRNIFIKPLEYEGDLWVSTTDNQNPNLVVATVKEYGSDKTWIEKTTFSGSQAPSGTYDLWYDTSTQQLKNYYNLAWHIVEEQSPFGFQIIATDTEPVDTFSNTDYWINSETFTSGGITYPANTLWVYENIDGTYRWTQANPGYLDLLEKYDEVSESILAVTNSLDSVVDTYFGETQPYKNIIFSPSEPVDKTFIWGNTVNNKIMEYDNASGVWKEIVNTSFDEYQTLSENNTGDIWYNTSGSALLFYTYNESTGEYKFETTEVDSSIYSLINDKTKIYYEEPTIYENLRIGDLWLDGNKIYKYTGISGSPWEEVTLSNFVTAEEWNEFISTAFLAADDWVLEPSEKQSLIPSYNVIVQEGKNDGELRTRFEAAASNTYVDEYIKDGVNYTKGEILSSFESAYTSIVDASHNYFSTESSPVITGCQIEIISSSAIISFSDDTSIGAFPITGSYPVTIVNDSKVIAGSASSNPGSINFYSNTSVQNQTTSGSSKIYIQNTTNSASLGAILYSSGSALLYRDEWNSAWEEYGDKREVLLSATNYFLSYPNWDNLNRPKELIYPTETSGSGLYLTDKFVGFYGENKNWSTYISSSGDMKISSSDGNALSPSLEFNNEDSLLDIKNANLRVESTGGGKISITPGGGVTPLPSIRVGNRKYSDNAFTEEGVYIGAIDYINNKTEYGFSVGDNVSSVEWSSTSGLYVHGGAISLGGTKEQANIKLYPGEGDNKYPFFAMGDPAPASYNDLESTGIYMGRAEGTDWTAIISASGVISGSTYPATMLSSSITGGSHISIVAVAPQYAFRVGKMGAGNPHIAWDGNSIEISDVNYLSITGSGIITTPPTEGNHITNKEYVDSLKAADSYKLDGQLGSYYLSTTGKAADSNKLNGQLGSYYLSTTAKAADSDKLDGQPGSYYLSTTAKAADSDKLDGVLGTGYVKTTGTQTIGGTKTFSILPTLPTTTPTTNQAVRKGYADSTYLGKTAKAADSDKLDGLDSTDFALASPAKPLATDFNTDVTQRQYYVASTTANKPSGSGDYGILLNYVSSGDTHNFTNNWLWQLYYDTNGNMYWRYKINNTSFVEWNKYFITDYAGSHWGNLTLQNNIASSNGTAGHLYLKTYAQNNANTFSELAFGGTRANVTHPIWLIRSKYVSNDSWSPRTLSIISQAYSGAAQNGVMELSDSGNLWIANNCSALSFTDRTPFYKGDALAEIKNIRGVTNSKSGKKEIDHKTLPEFARAKRKNADGVETDERDLGAMISILTTAVQQLTDKIERLENGTQKENKL